MIFVISAIAFLCSLVATWGLRRYALRANLLDVPNERSSHEVATPRGGGMAIVGTFLAALVALWIVGSLSIQPAVWLAVAGLLVALVGFIDDRGDLSARWRILVHFVAATLVVYALGGAPVVQLGTLQLDLGSVGVGIAVVGAVWLLNLYNFMDGIDGIAGVEAFSATAVMAYIVFGANAAEPIESTTLVLGAAVLGFLAWNFPPAKIFMGDVGSGFLGLMLAALLLWSAKLQPELLWSWLIILGVFVVDATFTLMRRLARGERVYEAHRSHAYQMATRRFGGHLPVTLSVLGINAIWLAPLAVFAAQRPGDGWWLLLLAYLPLVGLAVYFRAGTREQFAEAKSSAA